MTRLVYPRHRQGATGGRLRRPLERAQSSEGAEGVVKVDATITVAGDGVCTFSETDPYTQQ